MVGMQFRSSVPDLPLGEALRVRPAGITTVGLAVRIAVATTVSYFVAVELSGSTFVLFAPVTTLLVVQASPFATVGASLQRVLGTGLGVLLATLYVQAVDINAVSFFVAILVALLVARRLPVSLATQLQIPVAVVFVLALGTEGFTQDVWRVLDVLIGGAVGVLAVYAWPGKPDLEPAEAATDALRSALAAQLRSIGGELGTLPERLPDDRKHAFTVSSRALRGVSTAAREAYEQALTAVRFHPRARRASERLDVVAARVTWLGGLAIQIRAISGAADRLYDRPGLDPALDPAKARRLLESCADLIEAVDTDSVGIMELALGIQQRVALALDEIASDRVPVAEVLQSVSLLGRIDLLVESTVRPVGGTDPDDDEDDGARSGGDGSGPGQAGLEVEAGKGGPGAPEGGSTPGLRPAADGDR